MRTKIPILRAAPDLLFIGSWSRFACPLLWGEGEDIVGPSAERGLPAALFLCAACTFFERPSLPHTFCTLPPSAFGPTILKEAGPPSPFAHPRSEPRAWLTISVRRARCLSLIVSTLYFACRRW